ncbi:F0F1 ATP synthase subunit A [Anaeromyxobacter sp. PSR-1]|uniref:F0F1 ATP synthase subunit A n=1 Tax=unclassified Anaeromyxobacter TaxID=2620896 RepID=UPI0005DF4887|nr:F0F1 ATP synthase subunit A [Anaeromyxobacter sp. PSR-1]GAO02162.1 ATP synthase subunit a [Anaeromyxobacter sp. PSR-1]
MTPALGPHLPAIVVGNFLIVAAVLLALGKLATARAPRELPGGVQNAAEAVLDWFVGQARRLHPDGVRLIAPFLATLFLLILLSNLLALLPVPLLRIPPTSYYGATLALALVSVVGVLVIDVRLRGPKAGLLHLVWPNPLQLVTEVSHALSLSLRLYGNIGGELIVGALVTQAVPWGAPLLVHALGLFPVAIQPLVFTLLTANALAIALQGHRAAGAGTERSA